MRMRVAVLCGFAIQPTEAAGIMGVTFVLRATARNGIAHKGGGITRDLKLTRR
jgi:hypothetical protein